MIKVTPMIFFIFQLLFFAAALSKANFFLISVALGQF
jgi:hypothetical protein